jgi:hypothetical protein
MPEERPIKERNLRLSVSTSRELTFKDNDLISEVDE